MIRGEEHIVVMVVVVALLAAGAVTLTPDIKYRTVSKVQLAGAAGKAANFMARLGGGSTDVVSTVCLKGNKMLQADDAQATLIDLHAGQIETINHEQKTYTVLSFEDLRRQMEEMKAKLSEANEGAASDASASEPESDEDQPKTEMRFDFSVVPTGETSTFNGHRAERFLLTALVEVESTAASEEQQSQGQSSGAWAGSQRDWLSRLQAFQRMRRRSSNGRPRRSRGS